VARFESLKREVRSDTKILNTVIDLIDWKFAASEVRLGPTYISGGEETHLQAGRCGKMSDWVHQNIVEL
jgi:hypothetical protein